MSSARHATCVSSRIAAQKAVLKGISGLKKRTLLNGKFDLRKHDVFLLDVTYCSQFGGSGKKSKQAIPTVGVTEPNTLAAAMGVDSHLGLQNLIRR